MSFPNNGSDVISESFEYEFLTDQLIAVYSQTDGSYGILSQTTRETKCLKCTANVRSCVHVKAFHSYKSKDIDSNEDNQENMITQDINKSISVEKIPYPFQTADDIDKFSGYLSGRLEYPSILIPSYDKNRLCECDHQNYFSEVAEQEKKKAWLHLPHISFECTVYSRPVRGGCGCRQFYDGRTDLILNLDNKHMFPYTWLFEILHNTQETKFPLHAAFRSAKRTRVVLRQRPLLTRNHYEKLRQSYNCFLRLLNMNFEKYFECPKCKKDVDTIIMDGIMMGCRKDLVPKFQTPQKPDIQIKECSIEDRVFIRNPSTRSLLSNWAGRVKGSYAKVIDPISETDYDNLCSELSSNPSLRAVVIEAGNPCPKSMQKIAGELSRISPTCGIFQITANDEVTMKVRQCLFDFANGLFVSDREFIASNETLLKKTCPLLIDFMCSWQINTQTRSNLLKDLLKSVDGPFIGRSLYGQHYYGEISEMNKEYEFFPNYPLIRGMANYEADNKKEKLITGCRKLTHKHPTLTPGFFTLLCKHGVCIGFQFMDSPESPRTAFNLLVRHFDKMPRIVIYDNACKLHLTALKREPVLFQNTKFMVDRLHYRQGHIGCSLGYSMDTYSSDKEIKNINSQANEQANRKLRLLSTQAAYMSPENVIQHVKIFLAIRNIDKICQVARNMQ